jgi:putative colanic acid biosynthesis acetyltransferase WcaF
MNQDHEHLSSQPDTKSFKSRFIVFSQRVKYASPWSLMMRFKGAAWHIVWLLVFRTSPKHLYRWRNFLLGSFGAHITGRPFVSSSARIRMPWNLTLEDHACIGPDVEVYNLGPVTLKAHCTVAQEVYLCTGTHDLSDPHAPLMVAPIIVGSEAFIGVRALVLPGVVIGSGAVVGGGAVVSRDVPEATIVAGNPARPIGSRKL